MTLEQENAALREEVERLNDAKVLLARLGNSISDHLGQGRLDCDSCRDDMKAAQEFLDRAPETCDHPIARLREVEEVARELREALMAGRRAMHNDWHNKPRIGMEAECRTADAALARAEKAGIK